MTNNNDGLDGVRDLMADMVANTERTNPRTFSKGRSAICIALIVSFLAGAALSSFVENTSTELKSTVQFEQLTRNISRSLGVSAVDLRSDIWESLTYK